MHSVLTVGRPLGCTGHEGKALGQWHLHHAVPAVQGCRLCHCADVAPGHAWQVYKEITYQVRRLDHHASLAIWGGNNEIEVAFGWFPDSRDPDKARLYAADYNQVQAAHADWSCGALTDVMLMAAASGVRVHLCLGGR